AWRYDLLLKKPENGLECLTVRLCQKNKSQTHTHNVQVFYIGILVPWWFAAPITSPLVSNSNFTNM
uniref:Uncharacterized protein n=1 Tax=Macaca fascicularis TaxID=9541 RepID=A0A7N9DAW8_MACFA